MKLMDKLIVNKKIFLFLITIAISSIITGTIFALIICKNDNTRIINETNNFINSISSINYFESFKNIFFTNILFIIVIWIIGISVVGIPLSLILFFLKFFSLGFTITSFIIVYNLKGILISVIYIIPSQIINLIVIIYLLSISLIISFKLLNSILKRSTFNFGFISNYKKVLLFTILIFLVSTLYEVFIIPHILKLVLHFIN